MSSVEANISRFSGGAEFTAHYDTNRPTPPLVIRDILSQLAGEGKPKVVLDLGCGTGLSTRIWYDYADLVYGVDPSDDMRIQAEAALSKLHLDPNKIKFLKGDSGNVPSLQDGSIDIITCSQSLHWMEPNATFAEVHRLLRPGGIFASIDNDWPPIINAETEKLFVEYDDFVKNIGKEKDAYKGVQKWTKEGHLQRIKESGKFEYAREIVVHNVEEGDANRLVGLAMSMGSFSTIVRQGVSLEELGVDKYLQRMKESLDGKTWKWYFSYRLRVGFKAK